MLSKDVNVRTLEEGFTAHANEQKINKRGTGIAYCLHDDTDYLQASLDSLSSAGADAAVRPDVFAFISRLPWHAAPGDWHAAPGDWHAAAATAEALGLAVVPGDWPTEHAQRQAVLDHLLGSGYTHALIPDGDEIIEPALLRTLLALAEHELADRVYVHWDTYWKTPEYVIRPRALRPQGSNANATGMPLPRRRNASQAGRSRPGIDGPKIPAPPVPPPSGFTVLSPSRRTDIIRAL